MLPASNGDSVIQPQSVLIVSDNPLVRLGLMTLLQKEPQFQVSGESASFEDAVRDVQRLQPALAIVDLSPKNGMGIDLVRQLKAAHKGGRILVTSYYPETLYVGMILAAGAHGYLSKVARLEEIVQALQELAIGRMYVSPAIAQRMLSEVAGARTGTAREPLSALTAREFEVFEMIGRGLTTRRIANKLNLSVHTIETYRERIRQKLRIKSSTELSFQAIVWVLLNS